LFHDVLDRVLLLIWGFQRLMAWLIADLSLCRAASIMRVVTDAYLRAVSHE